MYEEENLKRLISFGFNVDRSDVFGVNVFLRKRGYTFPHNNMELKRVKEELASQKAIFLLMLKAVRNGKITDKFLDATEAALRMAGDQVSLSHANGSDNYIKIGATLYFDDFLELMSAIFESGSAGVCCFGVFWSCLLWF